MKKDSNDNADERYILLTRFLREVNDDPATAFFTEDDIVEIFDYANDIDSPYARTEALLYAAAHYPDSEPLAVRRAYHYWYEGFDSDAVMAALAQVPDSSLLGRLLKMRVQSPPADIAAHQLDDLIEPVVTFEDEQVIQLVDTASELGCLNWLRERFDTLRAKTSYKQTLLYELAEVFFEGGDYTTSMMMLDALTEIEPFNLGFWNRLTEVAGTAGEYERALQSAEYASAINPDDPHTCMLRARVLFSLQRDPDEIVALLEPIAFDALAKFDDPLCVDLLQSTYSWLLKQPDMARKVLCKGLDIAPGTRELFDPLLCLGSDDIEGYAKGYIDQHPEQNPAEIAQWGFDLLGRHVTNYNAVATFLNAYFVKTGALEVLPPLMQALYLARRLDEVEALDRVLDEMSKNKIDIKLYAVLTDPALLFARVMTALRRNNHRALSHALALINLAHRLLPEITTIEERNKVDGLLLRMHMIEELIGGIQGTLLTEDAIDRVDPFPDPANAVVKTQKPQTATRKLKTKRNDKNNKQ